VCQQLGDDAIVLLVGQAAGRVDEATPHCEESNAVAQDGELQSGVALESRSRPHRICIRRPCVQKMALGRAWGIH
jgi:hypothetical protein